MTRGRPRPAESTEQRMDNWVHAESNTSSMVIMTGMAIADLSWRMRSSSNSSSVMPQSYMSCCRKRSVRHRPGVPVEGPMSRKSWSPEASMRPWAIRTSMSFNALIMSYSRPSGRRCDHEDNVRGSSRAGGLCYVSWVTRWEIIIKSNNKNKYGWRCKSSVRGDER